MQYDDRNLLTFHGRISSYGINRLFRILRQDCVEGQTVFKGGLENFNVKCCGSSMA